METWDFSILKLSLLIVSAYRLYGTGCTAFSNAPFHPFTAFTCTSARSRPSPDTVTWISPGTVALVPEQMEHLFRSDTQCLSRLRFVNPAADALAAKCVRLFFHGIVRKSGRKMAVIQYSHLHISFSRFIQDDIHVLPPFFPTEIQVGTALYADSPDVAFVDCSHVLPQYLFRFPMHPKKRENIIVILVFQYFFYFFVHDPGPSVLLLCFTMGFILECCSFYRHPNAGNPPLAAFPHTILQKGKP